MGTETDDAALERRLREALASCPTRDELDAYVMGRSSRGQRRMVEHHLETGACERCARMAAAARAASSVWLTEPVDGAETRAPLRPRRSRRLAAACAAALALAVLITTREMARRPGPDCPYVFKPVDQTLGPASDLAPAVTKVGEEPLGGGRWLLQWKGVEGARGYTVTIFTLAGNPIGTPHEVREPQYRADPVPEGYTRVGYRVVPRMRDAGDAGAKR